MTRSKPQVEEAPSDAQALPGADAMLEWHRQWLESAALASQQIDSMARQLAAVLQQLHDTQLLWLGQWDHTEPGAAQPVGWLAEQDAMLKAWGQAQDEWLRMTRSWIDAARNSSTG